MQLQEQGQEWVTKISNMLKEHENDPEAMIEDIIFASKFYQYSEKNIQLMLHQNRGITYVASATAFEKMGYHVKENENGMIARVPVFAKYVVGDDNKRIYSQSYTSEIKEQIKRGVLKEHQVLKDFQFVPAFYDISQTDCPKEDYPSIFHMGVPSEFHQEAFEGMKSFAKESLDFNVLVTDLKSISLRGNCEHDNKIIRVNERLEPTMALSTLCHEIAHGIIHTSENSSKASTAQKECEADVMSIMLEASLGLPISESRREHLYRNFHAYKEEQAAKERPYEVTLEKLIDRVQTKVFRPYIDDIYYHLDQHLPAEGTRNTVLAENVVKNMALIDSVYDTSSKDNIDVHNELFDADRIDNYHNLYQQTKEEYQLSNSFVPKLAVIKCIDGNSLYDLYGVYHLDDITADLIQNKPQFVTPEHLPGSVDVGNILALKRNILEDSTIYRVLPEGLEDVTDTLQNVFVNSEMENRINCAFDVSKEYQCIHNLLKNGIDLDASLIEKYNSLCDLLGREKVKNRIPGNQMMARINLITENLSQNNRELIMEYIFRTGNYEKAELYAKKLEREPGIARSILQELRLVDSYKYMLWTIVDYESNHSVSYENRVTTGAYNSSSIPLLSENVHSLSQINDKFLLIKKFASAESIKGYSIVLKEAKYRIAYVDLDDYQPKVVFSLTSFASREEAEDFYKNYLQTDNTLLVDDNVDLVQMEHQENKIALSDVTSIGKTIASRKHELMETEMNEESAFELLKEEISEKHSVLNGQLSENKDIEILRDFKKMVNRHGADVLIELSNLNDFSDRYAMEGSMFISQELTQYRETISVVNLPEANDVRQCIDKALNGNITATDLEKTFNALDSAILTYEFAGIESEFENYAEYNNVLDTLKTSYVEPDKFCYVDYTATPGPYLYTNDPAGNIYKKSLRDEWNGSVGEMYSKLKESGYEVCSNFDDFRMYSANNRLSVGAPERKKAEAFVRIIESSNDVFQQNETMSIYDFKSNMDRLNTSSAELKKEVTYKLITRNNQEINSYIDTYKIGSERNVFEQLYDKVREQTPDLSKVIGKQYYQDQIHFNEQHLIKPLMLQLKREQKPLSESEELEIAMESNDKLKEVIKELDLSPADAEILKLNVGSLQTENLANIQSQIQMNQQMQQKNIQNKEMDGISII